jgi:hypothetical protein
VLEINSQLVGPVEHYMFFASNGDVNSDLSIPRPVTDVAFPPLRINCKSSIIYKPNPKIEHLYIYIQAVNYHEQPTSRIVHNTSSIMHSEFVLSYDINATKCNRKS